MRKAQSSVEFVILVGAFLFALLTFLSVIQGNFAKKSYEQYDKEVRYVAEDVRDELNLAAIASEGYRRNFTIPYKVLAQDFFITLDGPSVYVITDDGRHSISLDTVEVIGNVQHGINTINKTGGAIYVNS